jgi:hypothetical protein
MRTTLGSFGIWSDRSASDGHNRDRRNAGSESDRGFSDSGQFLPDRKAGRLEAKVGAASSCEVDRSAELRYGATNKMRTRPSSKSEDASHLDLSDLALATAEGASTALGACSERRFVTKTKEAG